MTEEEKQRAVMFDKHPLVLMAPVFQQLFDIKLSTDRMTYIEGKSSNVSLANEWVRLTGNMNSFNIQWLKFQNQFGKTPRRRTIGAMIKAIRTNMPIANGCLQIEQKKKAAEQEKLKEMKDLLGEEDLKMPYSGEWRWQNTLEFKRNADKFDVTARLNVSKDSLKELIEWLKKEKLIALMTS